MALSPFTLRSDECSRQKLAAELTRVLSSKVTLSLPIVLQGGSGLARQQLVRDVAADAGLGTTCVQCEAGSTPRNIMGLVVADLKGQQSHGAKKLSLSKYIDELSRCCPPGATRRCIIIDNIDCYADYPINAQLVLVSNMCWEPGMYNRALPTMAVFQFEQLSLDELQKILMDDPDLDVDDEARTMWASTVKKYLPYCAIWCRDLKGVQQKLQEVQCTSLQLDGSVLGEAELGQKLREQSWQMHSACSSPDDNSKLFVELRKQPTNEEVIERGVDCILLLISIYAAAWNCRSVDGTLMYGSGNRVKRKRDAQGAAERSKAKKVLDVIGGGPNGVPRSRLFEYMLFLCKVTDHRSEELDPDAASVGAIADMDCEQLAPREMLENDQHIEQDLQWCVQHRLMAEENREGKITYHLWFHEDIAVVLFKHLQHQGMLLCNDCLHNYLVYTK